MKKGFILLLILTHLFSVMGFSMAIHQCHTDVSYQVFGISLNKKLICMDEETTITKCCKNYKINPNANPLNKLNFKTILNSPWAERILLPSVTLFSIHSSITTPVLQAFKRVSPPRNYLPSYLLNNSCRI